MLLDVRVCPFFFPCIWTAAHEKWPKVEDACGSNVLLARISACRLGLHAAHENVPRVAADAWESGSARHLDGHGRVAMDASNHFKAQRCLIGANLLGEELHEQAHAAMRLNKPSGWLHSLLRRSRSFVFLGHLLAFGPCGFSTFVNCLFWRDQPEVLHRCPGQAKVRLLDHLREGSRRDGGLSGDQGRRHPLELWTLFTLLAACLQADRNELGKGRALRNRVRCALFYSLRFINLFFGAFFLLLQSFCGFCAVRFRRGSHGALGILHNRSLDRLGVLLLHLCHCGLQCRNQSTGLLHQRHLSALLWSISIWTLWLW
mmetsp:Transcript_11728/g.27649  ORF Transcript_11728/g.27649 Transcript_11728/m.27649 type:complete len:316 (-) Transcript_11728:767-1714(-)